MNIRKWKISRELLWIDSTMSHISLYDFNTKWTIINSNVSVPLLRCLSVVLTLLIGWSIVLCALLLFLWTKIYVQSGNSSFESPWSMNNCKSLLLDNWTHRSSHRAMEWATNSQNKQYLLRVSFGSGSQSLEFILNFAFSMKSKNSQERPINT